MNFSMFLVILIIGVISLGSVVVLFYYLWVNHLNAKGWGAQHKVERLIRSKSFLKNYKLLSDLTFANKNSSVPVQTLLVGPFGLLMVTTLGARGEYYGRIEDKDWIFVPDKKDIRTSIPNPLHQQSQAIAALREEFGKQKIYNVEITPAVVVTNKSKKTAVFVTQENLVFSYKEFKRLLGRSKFEQDKGLAVDSVSAVITNFSNKSASVSKP